MKSYGANEWERERERERNRKNVRNVYYTKVDVMLYFLSDDARYQD